MWGEMSVHEFFITMSCGSNRASPNRKPNTQQILSRLASHTRVKHNWSACSDIKKTNKTSEIKEEADRERESSGCSSVAQNRQTDARCLFRSLLFILSSADASGQTQVRRFNCCYAAAGDRNRSSPERAALLFRTVPAVQIHPRQLALTCSAFHMSFRRYTRRKMMRTFDLAPQLQLGRGGTGWHVWVRQNIHHESQAKGFYLRFYCTTQSMSIQTPL